MRLPGLAALAVGIVLAVPACGAIPGDLVVEVTGRSPVTADDAYLVEPGDGAPTTIYVRDGHRAFALWLTHPAADGALTQLARQVLAD